MTKKWLLCCVAALILGWVSAAQAGPSDFYRVKPGDTLLSRFGKTAAAAVCELNIEFGRIKNCNSIQAGQLLQLPPRVSGSVIVRKNVSAPVMVTPTESGVFRWVKVGGAPLYGCGAKEEGLINEEAWRKIGLTVEEQSEIRWLVAFQQHRDQFFNPGDRFEAVAFCRAGHVAFERNVLAAWQKDTVVLARTYVLKSGRVLHWVRNCNNWVVGQPLPPVAEPPVSPPAEPAEEPPVVATPPASAEEPPTTSSGPEPQEVAPKEAVYRWDWELVVGREYDRTSHSAFASGAVYPFILDGAGAEHAFGIGGTYSSWHGRTDTGFGFSGHLGGYGPAYKYSAYEGGWDLGLKLLPWATLTENGEQAAYHSRRHFDLRGITLAYNNYARELKGEKSFFKYQLFVSAFKPTGGEAEHSVFNQPLANPDSRLDRVVNIGGRVGLYDFSQEDDRIGAKLWFALGWFQEAPSLAETANWRFQLSDKHERVFFGIGRNYDLLNGGSLFGYGWSWDIRKTVYVEREEARRAQFIAAIEKAGGRLDKEGMVILPKGTENSQKQWKAAPSDD